MKKLPRQPMRPQEEANADKEIWQPTWQCFCCQDKGIVANHLAAMVIEGYDFSKDKLPRCQNPGCTAGSHFDGESITKCIDYRLSPAICQQLDLEERENWRKTLAQQHRQRLNLHVLAQKMNMRESDRTPEEEMEAQQKHYEAIAERKASGQ